MFIPLHDGNPLRYVRYPAINWALIAVNIAVWLVVQSGWVIEDFRDSIVSFGLIPAVLFGHAVLPDGYEQVPAVVTLGTSLFLHGDIIHLAVNMMFLWVFGDNVEDSMGHLAYLAFYLVCGCSAGAAFALAAQTGTTPLVGASGAAAGVVAAYLMLTPRIRIWVLVFARIPVHIAAVWVIGAWFLFQIGNAAWDPDSVVAWWAHIGGFLTGAALIPAFKRREVTLFEPAP
jgi:membrane associated rhomboid family serine protease